MRFLLVLTLLLGQRVFADEGPPILRYLVPDHLLASLEGQEPCSRVSTGQVCGRVPWDLAHDEGATEHEGRLFLFLRLDRLVDSTDRVFDAVDPERLQQVAPLLILAAEDMLRAISFGQYSSVFLVWVERKSLTTAPVSIWHMTTNELIAVGRNTLELRAAILAKKDLFGGEAPAFPRHDFQKL